MRSVALAGFRDVRRIFRCCCRDAVNNRDALHILLTRDRGTAERFRQVPAGRVLLGTGCRQGICRALSPSLGITLPGTRMQFKRKKVCMTNGDPMADETGQHAANRRTLTDTEIACSHAWPFPHPGPVQHGAFAADATYRPSFHPDQLKGRLPGARTKCWYWAPPLVRPAQVLPARLA